MDGNALTQKELEKALGGAMAGEPEAITGAIGLAELRELEATARKTAQELQVEAHRLTGAALAYAELIRRIEAR